MTSKESFCCMRNLEVGMLGTAEPSPLRSLLCYGHSRQFYFLFMSPALDPEVGSGPTPTIKADLPKSRSAKRDQSAAEQNI